MVAPAAAPAAEKISPPPPATENVAWIVPESIGRRPMEEPDAAAKVVQDPVPAQHEAPKQAKRGKRMLITRRKKMKKHQRKRLFTRMATHWKREILAKEKRKEYAFRQRLIEKVGEAKKFSAQTYVEDYLDDLHTELEPRTWKGRRLPVWLIKELAAREKLRAEVRRLNDLDILTGEPLIRQGETVQQFVERHEK